MRHKKLKLCALLLLGLGLTGLQAQPMFVMGVSGIQSSISVTDISKMSFSSGNIVIGKIDGSSVQYSLSGLRYLSFTDYSVGIPRIAESSKGSNAQIYPNPVADVLNIKLSKSENQPGRLEILSIEGRVVHAEMINSDTYILQIDASAFPKGLYLCRIHNGRLIETIKFIKQ